MLLKREGERAIEREREREKRIRETCVSATRRDCCACSYLGFPIPLNSHIAPLRESEPYVYDNVTINHSPLSLLAAPVFSPKTEPEKLARPRHLCTISITSVFTHVCTRIDLRASVRLAFVRVARAFFLSFPLSSSSVPSLPFLLLRYLHKRPRACREITRSR